MAEIIHHPPDDVIAVIRDLCANNMTRILANADRLSERKDVLLFWSGIVVGYQLTSGKMGGNQETVQMMLRYLSELHIQSDPGSGLN